MRLDTVATAPNPFAMLLDPERLARSVEQSERLNRLHSRVYRPLDKPVMPKGPKALAGDIADFDREIDALPEADETV